MSRDGKRSGRPLRCAGGISLALCIILPVVLFMFSHILIRSRQTRAEVDLVRGAALTAEAVLALYDRDLYREFGLFAFEARTADQAVSTLIGPDDQVDYTLRFQAELLDPDILKDGVARHMTLRAATSLIADAVDKFRSIRSLTQTIQLDQLTDLVPQAANAGYKPADPELDVDQDNPPDWLDEYNTYMDDQVRGVYQTGLTHLAPLMIPSEEGRMESHHFNPFDNSGLDTIGTVVDHTLLVAPEGVLDRIILSEYALSYFKNNTPFVIRQGLRQDDRTPDGRLIPLFPSNRDHEVEEIATGLEGRMATQAIDLFIGAIRFVLQLLNILTDEALMASYRATAEIIVVAVAAISLGEVVLPPQVVMWVLIAASALGQSVSDTIQLKKGYEIDLWPGTSRINVPMRYRDYLRLLIVLQSPDVIAARMVSKIAGRFPGAYFTEILCQAQWSGVSITHAASYLTRNYLPSHS